MHAACEKSGIDLDIVLATERFVVVNKPAGLLSVPGKGEDKQDCVAARVREMFPGATGPVTVHRLDMDTSGLIVCALDAAAQRELSRQFEQREVEKRYVALVDGVVGCESGTIDVPIRADIANRPYQVVDRSHGRPARTNWKVMAVETDRTRIELIPLTGRTHQLRVHCAYAGPGGMRGERGDAGGRGHPILGDILYGPPWIDPADAGRLMLHAAAMVFTDPGSGRRVEVRAPVPF
jgi:tRNA pseudouridine32 synthase/23S rRNA pseudouridine746 synthase